MDSTFGARLRRQREGQQIPLATIAEQTKIKASLLEGLERDDLSRWPKGIFRRSYFRTYVRAIGLEPDDLLREFMALHPDDEEEVNHALAQASQVTGYQPVERRPPTRLRHLIDSAVSALPALHFQPAARAGHGPEPPEPVLRLEPPPREPVAAPEVAFVPPAPVAPATVEPSVDFAQVAQLCTKLACAIEVCEVRPVLEEAVGVLRAVGLILWVRDRVGSELTPVVAHGYSPDMVARLARMPADADNAIAHAFRAAEPRIVDGGIAATGAVVVPLLTADGCSGVLALELPHGRERCDLVLASMTILAAQLSTLVWAPVLAEAISA